ncbi:RNA-binding S4 domain-containing protein, partial [Streptomyces luteocolor]
MASETSGGGKGGGAAGGGAAGEGGSVRVDSWIWSVRLVKTRSAGAAACKGGHVRVNGERVKPAYGVHVGDEVRVRSAGGHERIVVVRQLIRKRVGAPVAVTCYTDNTPPPP